MYTRHQHSPLLRTILAECRSVPARLPPRYPFMFYHPESAFHHEGRINAVGVFMLSRITTLFLYDKVRHVNLNDGSSCSWTSGFKDSKIEEISTWNRRSSVKANNPKIHQCTLRRSITVISTIKMTTIQISCFIKLYDRLCNSWINYEIVYLTIYINSSYYIYVVVIFVAAIIFFWMWKSKDFKVWI